jgi:Tfp pilus assembly protein PilO
MTLADQCARMPLSSRRAIALVIIPLVLLAAIAVLCAPAVYFSASQHVWRTEASEAFAQAQDAPQLRSDLERQLSNMRGSSLWSKLYDAAPGGVTAGLLHADVTALLAQSRLQAQSLAPIPMQVERFFTRVGVRFTASMRVDQLQQLITDVASHPRYLRIERLTIIAPQTQLENENPPLAVTAEIYAFERRSKVDSVLQGTASLASGGTR